MRSKQTLAIIALVALGVAPAGTALAQAALSAEELNSFTTTVTGSVTRIDRQSGQLTIQTIDGSLVLRFPPDALARLTTLHQGERVTFAVGFAERPSTASASPRTGRSAPGDSAGSASPPTTPVGLAGTIDGQVASVDARTGKLLLKTDDGTASLRFPPAVLQGLQPGDRLTVSVALIETPR